MDRKANVITRAVPDPGGLSAPQCKARDAMIDQPTYRTERLILRPVEIGDTGLLELHRADLRVARATQTIPHPLPPGATEALVRQAQHPDRTEDVWIIDASPMGQSHVSGVVRLKRLDRAQSNLFYWVAPPAWGAHIASEAIAAILEGNPHQATALFAEVFQDNPASARVLTNAGFEWLGDAETYSVARGAMVPTWTYSRRMV
ncbi:Protein N-acetyltransferase, RimJ/RimL family [Palleronia salina]|uniref:Protein N-acetyltransferase, RimJ/RimL family n=1 Tax=Palleronia salina TaxID=313368 RepID=A0A1M6BB91_9RHOB|nr:GNAT family protein [Palleronia salina]SHI45956.1 Protein N-acetyltransferase, RimJ/RimL family [Palleronia salina]